MALYRYRIVHEDKNTSVETDITEATEASCREGIKATVDTATFRVHANDLPVTIGIDDGIKIYFGEGNPTPTTLIGDYYIESLKLRLDTGHSIYTFKCTNKLEALLKNVRPSAFKKDDTNAPDTVGWTAPGLIEHFIDIVNEYNADKENWVNIGKDVQSTKGDGSAFPYIDYVNDYKPIFQQIEDVSTNQYTADGRYIFYLDTDNNFVWKSRPSTSSGNIIYGTDMINADIEKGVWDVINAIILNAGSDLNGSPIYILAYNLESIGEIGFKWKYVPALDIAKAWKRAHADITNNQTVREEIKKDARNDAEEIIDRLGSPRWKAKIEIRGNASYDKGNVYGLRVPELGWTTGNEKEIRLTDVTHRFSVKNGWTTTLSLEQDEETALDELVG